MEIFWFYMVLKRYQVRKWSSKRVHLCWDLEFKSGGKNATFNILHDLDYFNFHQEIVISHPCID